MRIRNASLPIAAMLLAVSIAGSPAFAARIRRGPTATKSTKHHHTSSKSSHAKHSTGPRAIEDARATQIQAALIKAGYLTGEPSGHWDSASQAAMEKLQADNGWQTKLVPDSRALIKLGLGPNHDTTATVANPTITASNNE